MRAYRALALAAISVVLAAGCSKPPEVESSSVVIGVGSTTEQQVLAGLSVAALQRAGITAEVRPDLGSTVGLRREAVRGRVDLFWDYTGAAWALGLREQAPPPDPVESWERVSRADEGNGLVWLDPSRANATLALFVRAEDLPDTPQARGMEWLARELSSGQARLCADPAFLGRPGGLDALAEEYSIDLGRLPREAAEEAEAITGVESGRCFAGLATATSGAARNAGLVPVADDLGVFPAFIVAPVARAGTVASSAEVARALGPVSAALDTGTLARLNGELEAGADPGDLAERFLDEVLGPEGAAAR